MLPVTGSSNGAGLESFLADGVLPGIRWDYARHKYDTPISGTSQSHDIRLLLRYHLPPFEVFYPFLAAEPARRTR